MLEGHLALSNFLDWRGIGMNVIFRYDNIAWGYKKLMAASVYLDYLFNDHNSQYYSRLLKGDMPPYNSQPAPIYLGKRDIDIEQKILITYKDIKSLFNKMRFINATKPIIQYSTLLIEHLILNDHYEDRFVLFALLNMFYQNIKESLDAYYRNRVFTHHMKFETVLFRLPSKLFNMIDSYDYPDEDTRDELEYELFRDICLNHAYDGVMEIAAIDVSDYFFIGKNTNKATVMFDGKYDYYSNVKKLIAYTFKIDDFGVVRFYEMIEVDWFTPYDEMYPSHMIKADRASVKKTGFELLRS